MYFSLQVVSAKFSDTLNRIIVTFDGVANKVDESTTLANMFPSDHTAFGTKSSFQFASKNLIIFLLGAPTINLGNLVLDASKIKSQAAKTIYPRNRMETFALERPDTVEMPEVQMMGPSSVGKRRALFFL